MKKLIAYSTIIFFVLSFYSIESNKIIKKHGLIYFNDKIIVKISDNSNTPSFSKKSLSKKIQTILGENILFNFEQKFSPNENLSLSKNQLSKIYSIEFEKPVDPLELSKNLSRSDEINWAEPHFIHELTFEPNDYNYERQKNLHIIEAEKAWDVNKGDSSIVIAIIDTGVDWDHTDLSQNIWLNKNEIPNNGIDDDNNGYVDDVRGWDFGGINGIQDNNPDEDRADHGTHVAGIASAVTNNSYGISSIGYNCKIMVVKVSQDDIRDEDLVSLISHGYEGIKYAVDNGANVINCSWGRLGESNLGREIVEYALSKGCLIVASAGNSNEEQIISPASYKGVLSVGSTDNNDIKSEFSNYGINLDVLAPGNSVYSTWQNDTFNVNTGTSMSTPLVSGLAGLAIKQFPDYNPIQITQQIRVNTDKIYSINQEYEYLLGSGRINAFNSLVNKNSKSARISNWLFNDNGNQNGVLEPNENGSLELTIMNYLDDIENLKIEIINHNNKVLYNADNIDLGSLIANASVKIVIEDFTINTNAEIINTSEENFIIKYFANDYEDFEWISLNLGPSFYSQNNGVVALTVCSNGTIGYNDYPINLQGYGFRYEYVNLSSLFTSSNLIESALIYGTSSNKLVDAVRSDNPSIQNRDFKPVVNFHFYDNDIISGQQGKTIFNDEFAGENKLGIETELNSFTFNNPPDNEYIILSYNFINRSGEKIKDFYGGLFFDWNVARTDNVAYDLINNFVYQYSHREDYSRLKIGVCLLSAGDVGFYPINNFGDELSFSIRDGFSKEEKWQALSGGIYNVQIGPSDVSYVLSAGPFDIKANDTVNIAFSISAENDINNLIDNIDSSKKMFKKLLGNFVEEPQLIPEVFKLEQNYPNPFNSTTTIKFEIPEIFGSKRLVHVKIKLYDILGRYVDSILDEYFLPGSTYEVILDLNDISLALSSGVYLYRMEANNFVSTKKMILLK